MTQFIRFYILSVGMISLLFFQNCGQVAFDPYNPDGSDMGSFSNGFANGGAVQVNEDILPPQGEDGSHEVVQSYEDTQPPGDWTGDQIPGDEPTGDSGNIAKDEKKEKEHGESVADSEQSNDGEDDLDELKETIAHNEACRDLFFDINAYDFPQKKSKRVSGISGDIVTANVDSLQVSGISQLIAGKNLGTVRVSGIHGSICIQAQEVSSISGIKGQSGDLALFGPKEGLGQAQTLSGIAGSDMVLVNFNVKRITGIGRSLHIYGGHVERISGIFQEIHVYKGATIGNKTGINSGLIVHNVEFEK